MRVFIGILLLKGVLALQEPRPNIVIKDDQNRLLKDVAGPYNEGDSLTLICETNAGNINPAVYWWTENNLIDDTFTQKSRGVTKNWLVIMELRRSNFMQEFTCEMYHPNLTQTFKASVKIDMNLKPLNVRILTMPKPVWLGEKLTLVCRTEGSRPESKIVWWIDNERIQSENQTESSQRNVVTSSDGQVTYSNFTFTPGIDDSLKAVICKAENPAFPRLDMRDTWILHVHYNVCGENEFYNECPCPLTCDNFDIKDRMCSKVCVEGCDCQNGYVRNADGKCVKPEHCGNRQIKSRSDCSEAKEFGTCEDTLPRYFFNNQTGECERFMYSGCGGSSNNFNLMEDCEKVCLN